MSKGGPDPRVRLQERAKNEKSSIRTIMNRRLRKFWLQCALGPLGTDTKSPELASSVKIVVA